MSGTSQSSHETFEESIRHRLDELENEFHFRKLTIEKMSRDLSNIRLFITDIRDCVQKLQEEINTLKQHSKFSEEDQKETESSPDYEYDNNLYSDEDEREHSRFSIQLQEVESDSESSQQQKS